MPVRLLITVTLMSLAFTASASAQTATPKDPGTWSISPATRTITANPGDTLRGQFKVLFRNEQRSRYAVSTQSVQQRRDGSLVFDNVRQATQDASGWVTATPDRFTGKARGQQPVIYTIRVPRNATPGDHVASVTVTKLEHRGQATVKIRYALAMRLVVQVAGDIQPGAAFTRLDAPTISTGGDVVIKATVRNTGNTVLDFDRANKAGLDVGDRTYPLAGVLLPGSERDVTYVWKDAPIASRATVDAHVTVAKDQDVHKQATVWILPLLQAAGVLLLACALLVLRRRAKPGRADHGAIAAPQIGGTEGA